jgi:hypothetical protein
MDTPTETVKRPTPLMLPKRRIPLTARLPETDQPSPSTASAAAQD